MTAKHRGGVTLPEECWAWLRKTADRDGLPRDDLIEGLIWLAMDEDQAKVARRKQPVDLPLAKRPMNRFESYSVVALDLLARGKPPTNPDNAGKQHVSKNGGGTALCGVHPVRYIGEVGMPDTEDWPWCITCTGLAGQDVMDTWL